MPTTGRNLRRVLLTIFKLLERFLRLFRLDHTFRSEKILGLSIGFGECAHICTTHATLANSSRLHIISVERLTLSVLEIITGGPNVSRIFA